MVLAKAQASLNSLMEGLGVGGEDGSLSLSCLWLCRAWKRRFSSVIFAGRLDGDVDVDVVLGLDEVRVDCTVARVGTESLLNDDLRLTLGACGVTVA